MTDNDHPSRSEWHEMYKNKELLFSADSDAGVMHQS